jgi:hypothetical protein
MKNIDDLKLDDIPADDLMVEKKKKKNGCVKGKVAERDLCHQLSDMFNDTFRRVPGSGMFMGGKNFFRNQNINDAAKNTLTGDIITPLFFKFSLESKAYNDTPKMHSLLNGQEKDLDKWIKQASDDAAKCNKDWILIFKITSKRKAFICMNWKVFHEYRTNRSLLEPNSYTKYGENIIIDKDLFFNTYLSQYKSISDRFYTPVSINNNNTSGV